ncbi:MipA/OmpV family protein [Colwellia sp. 75C3]|uniref:MipA/OmpV family protein n=1 Tax=Colwellia sp. 75C3 TaxID=888425 RepID=UPI000C34BDFA|nr:MipA/OmpV family protein [Colwellia sp. 75C3]PKG82470.1 MipA/OmpV family protein [Colwellia sp. 75C3]
MITFCKDSLCSAMPFKKNNIRRIHNKRFSWLLALNLLIFSCLSYGQDTSEIQVNDDSKPVIKDGFEWQFLLDLSLVYDPQIIAGIEQNELSQYFMPGLLVDISYKGFFLQTNQRRSNALLGGTELGYQVIVEENWQLDLIAKAYMQGYDSDSLIEYGGGDDELLEGLRERDATIGIAVRYSHYLQDALFTLDFAYGSSSDDVNGDHVGGIIIDSFYSHLLPYKNWDIYLGTGLTYFSQDIVNHYIGVGSDEVTDIRPAYTANGGFRGQVELYVQHPLSASWSFQAGMTHSIFSNDVKKSPLVDTNQVTQVMLGVLYVF